LKQIHFTLERIKKKGEDTISVTGNVLRLLNRFILILELGAIQNVTNQFLNEWWYYSGNRRGGSAPKTCWSTTEEGYHVGILLRILSTCSLIEHLGQS
jgi:monomeric isocitrate dehydrogenase